MDRGERERMETAFGRDFSSVRLHTDDAAARLARDARANAVTIGSDIFFARGTFDSRSRTTDRLLAHELAHVVQHSGGDAYPDGPIDPERAANVVAERVLRGQRAGFGLRPASAPGPSYQQPPQPQPSAPPTPQPSTQPSTQPTTQPSAQPTTQPSAQPTTQPSGATPQQTWAQQVAAAQGLTDPVAKSSAMTALIRQALGPGRTVREAGTTNTARVDPVDYDPPPAINFDLRLNSKQMHARPGTVAGVGYHFFTTVGSARQGYAILGPLALNASSGPVWTQMYAAHELYHTAHHATSTASFDAREVEAWTDTFVNFFLPTFSTGQSWTALIGYYQNLPATDPARASSVASLVAFYRGLSVTAPPSGGLSDRGRFEAWLRRRLNDPATATKALVVELSNQLGITATAPRSPSAPPTAPPPSAAPTTPPRAPPQAPVPRRP
jgi:hypothetical protein